MFLVLLHVCAITTDSEFKYSTPPPTGTSLTVSTTIKTIEKKHFLDWFEDNSVSTEVETMSKQRLNDGPRAAPVRNARVNPKVLVGPQSTEANIIFQIGKVLAM